MIPRSRRAHVEAFVDDALAEIASRAVAEWGDAVRIVPMIELTPGIRSILIEPVDPRSWPVRVFEQAGKSLWVDTNADFGTGIRTRGTHFTCDGIERVWALICDVGNWGILQTTGVFRTIWAPGSREECESAFARRTRLPIYCALPFNVDEDAPGFDPAFAREATDRDNFGLYS